MISKVSRGKFFHKVYPILLLAFVTVLQVGIEDVSAYDAQHLFYLSSIVFTSLFYSNRFSISVIFLSAAVNLYVFQEPKYSLQILPINAIELSIYLLLALAINYVIQSFKERQENLSVANNRFKQALKGASEGMLMSNGEGKFVFVSDSVRDILGYSPEEYMSVNPYTLIHPEDITDVLSQVRELKERSNGVLNLEYRHMNKAGEWVWLEVTLNNFLEDPSVATIFCHFKSINSRKVAEIEKSDFINFAAHEFKTPLTVIKAYSQALLKNEDRDEKSLKGLKTIERQANNLNSIVKTYLETSRKGNLKPQLNLAPSNLSELVQEVIETIEISQRSHTIFSYIAENVIIQSDKQKLRQVIVNYLTNAIKFSPAATKVEVRLERYDGKVRFTVTDFGLGIDPKNQELIFDKRYRVKGAQDIDGSGFGLYICAQIIEIHQGEIGVISKLNEGSTFWFELPVLKHFNLD